MHSAQSSAATGWSGEIQRLTIDSGSDFAVIKNDPAIDYGIDWPAGQLTTAVGTPARPAEDFLVYHRPVPFKIDQSEVGIESFCDESFVGNAIESSGTMAHPFLDLL